MRHPLLLGLIACIEDRRTLCPYLRILRERLSAAGNATTRACHDLYEVVLLLTAFNASQELLCIGKTMRYCYTDLLARHIDLSLSNPVKSTNRMQFEILKGLIAKGVVHRP